MRREVPGPFEGRFTFISLFHFATTLQKGEVCLMSQEPNHIDAAIADLEAWRDRINASIETLKHLRTQGSSLPSAPPPGGGKVAQGPEITHDAFFQMTIPDAAKKYLGIVKQTKPNPEIAEALIKGGLKSFAKNFPETLRSILSRDDRFVRVNSEWGLSEWYPAMRRERKPRASNGGEEPQMNDKDSATESHETPAQATHEHSNRDTLKVRTLRLINESPGQIFSAEDLATTLEAKIASIRVCLSELFNAGSIAKISPGRYQSKKGQTANAA